MIIKRSVVMKKHLAIIVETNGDTDTYEKISW